MENEIYEAVDQENTENAVEVYEETGKSGGGKLGAVLGGAALVAGVIGIITIVKKRKAKKEAREVEDAFKTLEKHGYDVNTITSTFEDNSVEECEVVDAE